MTAVLLPFSPRASRDNRVLALEQTYYRLKARAELEPSIDNMRAAVAAYDSWHSAFRGISHG